MNDEETAVALQQPEEAPACSGCQGPLIVEAYFCHQCGVRVRPDPFPLGRLVAASLLAVFGLTLSLVGLANLSQSPLASLLMFSITFVILREVRNLLR